MLFYFSAYENDSTDNTSEILKNLDWSFFKDFSIVTEKIKTKPYKEKKQCMTTNIFSREPLFWKS